MKDKIVDQINQLINVYGSPIRRHHYINGLMQDCSISSANALEILQSFTKPSIYIVITSQFDLYQYFHYDEWQENTVIDILGDVINLAQLWREQYL